MDIFLMIIGIENSFNLQFKKLLKNYLGKVEFEFFIYKIKLYFIVFEF